MVTQHKKTNTFLPESIEKHDAMPITYSWISLRLLVQSSCTPHFLWVAPGYLHPQLCSSFLAVVPVCFASASVADPGCVSRIRIFSIPHPGSEFIPSRIRIKNFKYLTQKSISKLSEIWSGLFIPDPDPDFLPIPDPGVRKAADPGSGSAQH